VVLKGSGQIVQYEVMTRCENFVQCEVLTGSGQIVHSEVVTDIL